ncbi:glycosyltransferase family 4 protein, partial [Streptomyces anulatus]
MSRDIFIVSNSTDELGGVTAWMHQTARLFAGQGHKVHAIGIHASDLKMALPGQSGQPAHPVTALYPAHPPTPWTPHGVRPRIRLPTPPKVGAPGAAQNRAGAPRAGVLA